eukprot:SAG31_NODE_18632_length_629_cov_0.449057_1_plen_156_part_01
MLESMIESPAPTRAECADIAAAVFGGADAVMLSGETAAGKYPEESVAMQRRVIATCEADPRWQRAAALDPPAPLKPEAWGDAVATAAAVDSAAGKASQYLAIPPLSWKQRRTPTDRRYADARSHRMPPVQYISTVLSRRCISSTMRSATAGNSVKC